MKSCPTKPTTAKTDFYFSFDLKKKIFIDILLICFDPIDTIVTCNYLTAQASFLCLGYTSSTRLFSFLARIYSFVNKTRELAFTFFALLLQLLRVVTWEANWP